VEEGALDEWTRRVSGAERGRAALVSGWAGALLGRCRADAGDGQACSRRRRELEELGLGLLRPEEEGRRVNWACAGGKEAGQGEKRGWTAANSAHAGEEEKDGLQAREREESFFSKSFLFQNQFQLDIKSSLTIMSNILLNSKKNEKFW